MSAWLKRFSLHLAAAVGATGIFVAAAAVGATQTRQQAAVVATAPPGAMARSPLPGRKPSVSVPTPSAQAAAVPPTPVLAATQPSQPSAQTPAQPSPQTAAQTPAPTPGQKVNPERSVSGTIKNVLGDGLEVLGNGGREWRVTPVPGAFIRLNGKAARLDELQPGDSVTILGQAQGGPRSRFVAHAITARRK